MEGLLPLILDYIHKKGTSPMACPNQIHCIQVIHAAMSNKFFNIETKAQNVIVLLVRFIMQPDKIDSHNAEFVIQKKQLASNVLRGLVDKLHEKYMDLE